MLQYFRIRKPRVMSPETRKQKKPCEIIFTQKSAMFAKDRKETYIPKNKSILILGAAGSGKTKELRKLYESRELIYKRHKANFVYLNCNDSVSDWIAHNIGESIEEYIDEDLDSRSLYIKIQALINYSDKAIIFIDDLHKATGRKLEVIKDINRVCKIFIATATQKHHINKTVLQIMGKDYKEIQLTTEAAKDATNILLVILLFALIISGNIELALLITAGRLMLKQNNTKGG